ncbi:ArnT family glycosyltransferase [Phycicoccus ginsengisoli]
MAVLVGLVVSALGIVYRTEIVPTDPWHYVRAAASFPSDTWAPLGYTRYGMILPIGPLYLLFRNAQITYYFWPILASGLLAGTVYLLAQRHWGRVAGLLAVVLLVSNPIVFVNLSRGYPDLMSTALFCLALVLSLLARQRMVEGARAPITVLLAVGFFLGWGFETRETSMLTWPIIALVLWRREQLLRTAALVMIPIAGWAAIDILIGAVAYGDPLLKLHTFTRQDLAATTNPADIAAQKQFVGRARSYYLTVIPDTMRGITGGPWMLGVGALALVGFVVRNRAVQLMSAWFVLAYLTFVGIGGFFVPSHPAGRLDVQRYWIAFFPPAAIAAASVVATLAALLTARVGAPRLRLLGAAALALVVAAGPVVTMWRSAVQDPVYAPNGATALQEMRTFMTSSGVKKGRVWTDWESARIMPIYERGPWGGEKRWTATFKSLTGKNANPRSGDYVAIFSPRDATCSFCRLALAPWLKKYPTLPASWTPVFTASSDNLTVYRVQ